MKKIRFIGIIFSLLLTFGNLFVFSYSITLSDKIATIEDKTKTLNLNNAGLKKKLYSENSFEMLYNKAKVLGFEKKASTFYFPPTKFAYSQTNIHE